MSILGKTTDMEQDAAFGSVLIKAQFNFNNNALSFSCEYKTSNQANHKHPNKKQKQNTTRTRLLCFNVSSSLKNNRVKRHRYCLIAPSGGITKI